MKIEKLMTPDVVTVRPDTLLKEAAALLVENRISGLPVCDEEGHVLGVVSEADILVKEQGIVARAADSRCCSTSDRNDRRSQRRPPARR